MLGMGGATSVVAVQLADCVSGIISMCGVGLVIYQIGKAEIDIDEPLPSKGLYEEIKGTCQLSFWVLGFRTHQC